MLASTASSGGTSPKIIPAELLQQIREAVHGVVVVTAERAGDVKEQLRVGTNEHFPARLAHGGVAGVKGAYGWCVKPARHFRFPSPWAYRLHQ